MLTTGSKIRLAFIIPTAVTLVALISFSWFMQASRHDSIFINVIGMQRKLSQQLQDFTMMVHIGQEVDKRELSRAISEFNYNLDVFENGGVLRQQQLPPLPIEVMQGLTAVNDVWVELKPHLNLILETPAESEDSQSAYHSATDYFPELAEASANLVLSYQDRVDKLRMKISSIMVLLSFCIFSSTIAGVWVMRRYTNEQLIAGTKLRKEKDEQVQLVQQLQSAHTQLLQSEKLASIGQLAAGVAHEINNPVGYINSNIGSLRNALNDLFKLLGHYEEAEDKLIDETTRENILAVKQEVEIDYLKEDLKNLLNESQEGIVRVKQIVQDLKDFAHIEEAEWQWADLHKGLNSTLNIVNNEIKYKADVVKEYGNIPHVECIISQLNQVFMNLLVNAAHAIEERGTIIIRTGQKESHVWVSVEDTGKGMDLATRQKIFDPFFTTKGVGKGTGLGLSLSYSIIQKHNGTIAVESEPGKGTTFYVQIPIAQPEKKAGS